MRELTVFFGPPGTGKTHRLSQVVEEEWATHRVRPGDVAFVSFSRRAIAEARERNGIKDQDVGYWRTIHSLAYTMLGLMPDQVVGRKELEAFADQLGEPPPTPPDPETRPWEHASRLSMALQLYQQARARQTSLSEEWSRWDRGRMEYRYVKRYIEAYTRWKHKNEFYDFEDMITQASGQLPVAALIVDEAQDTSPSSWAFLRRVTPPNARVYVAGDDDQTIYGWAGADVTQMLRWQGQRIVLPHSWRLSHAIKEYADQIAQHITMRYPKTFTARAEHGEVLFRDDLAQLTVPDEGSVLLLARSRREAARYVPFCRQHGVVYNFLNGDWSSESLAVRAAVSYEALRKGKTIARQDYRRLVPFLPFAAHRGAVPEQVHWDHVLQAEHWHHVKSHPWFEVLTMSPEDRSYIRALRRRKEPLHGPGRVRILTIHQSKGAEADHVLLNMRLPRPALEALRSDGAAGDAERRVWYVGATRARHTLTLLTQGRRCFR